MGHQEVPGRVVYSSTDRILAVELFERIMKAVTLTFPLLSQASA